MSRVNVETKKWKKKKGRYQNKTERARRHGKERERDGFVRMVGEEALIEKMDVGTPPSHLSFVCFLKGNTFYKGSEIGVRGAPWVGKKTR